MTFSAYRSVRPVGFSVQPTQRHWLSWRAGWDWLWLAGCIISVSHIIRFKGGEEMEGRRDDRIYICISSQSQSHRISSHLHGTRTSLIISYMILPSRIVKKVSKVTSPPYLHRHTYFYRYAVPASSYQQGFRRSWLQLQLRLKQCLLSSVDSMVPVEKWPVLDLGRPSTMDQNVNHRPGRWLKTSRLPPPVY